MASNTLTEFPLNFRELARPHWDSLCLLMPELRLPETDFDFEDYLEELVLELTPDEPNRIGV